MDKSHSAGWRLPAIAAVTGVGSVYVAIQLLHWWNAKGPAQAWALAAPLFLLGMLAGCLPIGTRSPTRQSLERGRFAIGLLLLGAWLFTALGFSLADSIAAVSVLAGCWFTLNHFASRAPIERRGGPWRGNAPKPL